MRLTTHVAVLYLLVCASVATAQLKAFGTLKCSKPDVEHKVDVGPNHSLVLDQAKCSVGTDKPFEISGVKSGNGFSPATLATCRETSPSFMGYHVDTMENGDKGEYSFQGTATMKDAVIQTAEDSWTLIRGTGKLKGAKGKGTGNGTGDADGSITCECAGEYTLASN